MFLAVINILLLYGHTVLYPNVRSSIVYYIISSCIDNLLYISVFCLLISNIMFLCLILIRQNNNIIFALSGYIFTVYTANHYIIMYNIVDSD